MWSTWLCHCHLTGRCFADTHIVDKSCDQRGYATVIWLTYVLSTHIWSTIHVIDMVMPLSFDWHMFCWHTFGQQFMWPTRLCHCHLTDICFVDTHLVDNSCDRHGYATVIWLANALLTHIWSTIHLINVAMIDHLTNTEHLVDRWLVDTAIRATTPFFRLTVCRPNVFRWNDMEPFE
jgi:hypothetical protein